MKRNREPSLQYRVVDGEYYIIYDKYTYKWLNSSYRYTLYIRDHNFDCDIVDSKLIITDIRTDKMVLAQPLQLVE
jgi:hypothetical protein